MTKKEATEIKTLNNESVISTLKIADISKRSHDDIMFAFEQACKEFNIDNNYFKSSYLLKGSIDVPFYILNEKALNLITSRMYNKIPSNSYDIKYELPKNEQKHAKVY